jgi:beta-N-acetylhexosaminidase
MSPRPSAIVYGCAGLALSAEEKAFFAAADPLGLILFRRNCSEPAQVTDLANSFRTTVGRADAPVLIDQEGGRVQRLNAPHWDKLPTQRRIGLLAEQDATEGLRAAHLLGRTLAAQCAPLGVTVDCAPVVDLLLPGAHEVIGDRAFSADPILAAKLGRAVAEGLLAGGVMPIVKHMPGHGRAIVDSHAALPVVDADLATLDATDFVPFRALADMPMAMVAHVVYTAVDRSHPVTVSARAVDELLRRRLGFDGVLIADDIGMQALRGTLKERAAATLASGIDLTLHCSGILDDMKAISEAVPAMSDAAWTRWRRAVARVPAPPPHVDARRLAAELDTLLGPVTV